MAHTTSAPSLTHVPLDPSNRPRYSPEQLQSYFHRINLPPPHLSSPIITEPSPIITEPSPTLAQTTTHGLPLLRALQRHHAASIPFENLELHYSAHKRISLDPSHLYTKFVSANHGRGGRCMENNTFFATVLRSLGYVVRNCAGRVSRSMSPVQEVREQQGQTYDGWNHMLNLVRLDGAWWVVDVGMGAMGPNVVYKLEDGMEMESIAPRRIRLQRRAIAESYATTSEVDEEQKLWCYDVCPKPHLDPRTWIPAYAFTLTEFLPQDYEMMSYFTSSHPACFFTYSLVCMKMLLGRGEDGEEGEEKIVGDVTLYNDGVRKNVGAEREVLRELRTEGERVEALRETLGVELTGEEREGLRWDLRLG